MKTFLFFLLLTSFMWSKTVFSLSIGSLAGLNISNIIIYFSIIVILISDFATGRIKNKKIPQIWVIIGIVILLIFSFVYAQTNAYPSEGVFHSLKILKRMYFDPLMLYILACLLVDSKKDAIRYLMIIVFFFSFLNIVSLVLLKLNINFFVVQEHSQRIADRFTGFIGNPNKTSYMLSFLMPFLFYFIKIQKGLLLKIIFGTMFVSNTLTVVISGSRGGVLALIAAILSVFLLNKEFLKLASMLIISIAGVVYAVSEGLVFVVYERFSPLLQKGFTTGSFGSDGGDGGRFAIWGELLNVYCSDIFTIMIGLGFGKSENVGMKADPHNFYLQILTEFGIVGFFLFLMVIFSFTTMVWFKKTKVNHKFKFYIISAWAAIAVGWTFSSLDGIMNYVLLTMGVAISYLTISENKSILR